MITKQIDHGVIFFELKIASVFCKITYLAKNEGCQCVLKNSKKTRTQSNPPPLVEKNSVLNEIWNLRQSDIDILICSWLSCVILICFLHPRPEKNPPRFAMLQLQPTYMMPKSDRLSRNCGGKRAIQCVGAWPHETVGLLPSADRVCRHSLPMWTWDGKHWHWSMGISVESGFWRTRHNPGGHVNGWDFWTKQNINEHHM